MSSNPKAVGSAESYRRMAGVPWKPVIILGALLLLYLFTVRWLPRLLPYPGQEALDSLRYSRVILDAEGRELQVLPLQDGLRRLYVSGDQVPEELVRMILRSEDRRFYFHPGVDPFALLRAAYQNITEGRTISGASTLSMQVARLLVPRERTMAAKLAEAWEALQLESRVGKQGVLNLYFNLLPFGRNVEGFEAAARVYFGLTLKYLTQAQLMVLCVIPRAPARYDPRLEPEVVGKAISRLAASLGAGTAFIHTTTEAALASVVDPDRPGIWPFRAPHYLVYLEASGALDAMDGREPFRTGIEGELQAWLEDLLARTVEEARGKRISNAAALFVRPLDMRIAAWVGSINFHDAEASGQVDGVIMRRQPGSTLKPFLYALALERGWNAATILPDVPTDFGGAEVYVPANFNNQFNGPVRLRQALASSLNIPAVYTLERVGVTPFAELLIQCGFDSIEDQRGFLGLGLALGNAEVSLFELVRAYGIFINDGIPATLHHRPGQSPYGSKAQGVIDPRISMLIRDILTRHPDRTLAFGRGGYGRLRFEGAMKTGTSNQFNNIWAVGFTADLLGGVWMGNFSGSTVQGTADSGYPAAILSKTLEAFSDHTPFPELQGLERRNICSLSGMAAGPDCPHVLDEWFLPGTEPPLCDWHASGPSGAVVRYPQEYRLWFSRYRYGSATNTTSAKNAPLRIVRPVDGAVFFLDPAQPVEDQAFLVQVLGSGSGTLALDGTTYWRGNFPADIWLPLERGSHAIDLFQDDGSSAGIHIEAK